MPDITASLVIRSLWVACVQRVRSLCVSLGQVTRLLPILPACVRLLGTNTQLLRSLYYFCTQHLPTPSYILQPLLVTYFSTPSTRLIKTTTLNT